MKEESKVKIWNKLSVKQKLFSVGLMSLLTIGALGAMNEYSGNKNGIFSSVAEKVGLKSKETTTTEAIQPVQTGTPQLSKEYVYAGSRMLATEDYGIAPANPTPTP
ncbi:MAG TPA: hypothetical protein PKY82_00715 [Pyrinomonadaceae bacterium]|nr:hypothetical protein [Pyrinomonadaceae bacterium]HRH40132.1 hypothetical protein [Pyrinomonadaceae bacterium]